MQLQVVLLEIHSFSASLKFSWLQIIFLPTTTSGLRKRSDFWFVPFLFFVSLEKIVIASIMCGYSKEDWTELAQMAEVICTNPVDFF